VPYPPSVAPLTRPVPFEGSLLVVLGRVRRGRGDPCMRLWDRGCWRATRTPDGPSTLSLTVSGGFAEATAWGRGSAWTIEHLPDLLGMSDDTVGDFAPPPGLVRDLSRGACLRIGRTLAVAEALVPTVLEQRVTGVAARRSWRQLVRRFGEQAPGPVADLMLPPAPEVLAATPSWVFHRAGVERSRAETITGALRRVERVDETASMSLPDAHRRLQAFPGIGVWTTNEVALTALGDPDAVSVGDYHLKNLVSFALAGEPRGTDERMLELLEPYRGHRARALRLIETSGHGAPRFGPKVAIPAIAAL
jgi:3-methyladenine DNA glycosylase/8-oxoguanine DNA glycosylase